MFSGFRRNIPQIPPVADSVPAPRSLSNNNTTYNQSRGGPSPYAERNDFPRQRSPDQDRNELFSGYRPALGNGRPRNEHGDDGYNAGMNDGFAQPGRRAGPPQTQEELDEDVEAIRKDIRFTKQESVQSTRNALRIAREAEETARNTLLKLGDQSEKIANTERLLDMGKAHSNRASDRTDELKQLNRSIFRPVIVFNKDKKRAAEEERIRTRHESERDEREKAMADVRESQNRIGRAATYGRGEAEDAYQREELLNTGRRRFVQPELQRAREDGRKRFQFEKTASDDELEDELDDNLDDIHDVSKRFRALALAAGEEVDNHIKRLDRITDKTIQLDDKVIRNTDKLKRI